MKREKEENQIEVKEKTRNPFLRISPIENKQGLIEMNRNRYILGVAFGSGNYSVCRMTSETAGILERRLRIGMALQVDATVSYITNGNTTRITKEDLNTDSFYNTYEYPGLPLGPIANPGIESIQAALSPQESNYLYYLSTPEGETIFSETLEQHNEAKVTYLR